MKPLIYLVLLAGILSSCSVKIRTTVSKKSPPLDYKEEVVVIPLKDPVPEKAEEIGTVKIGDTGFTTNCGYEVVIDAAKAEARKAGGNAIKITDHIPPNFWGSTCHQITAKILKISDFSSIKSSIEKKDSINPNIDYAIVHVYRFSGPGALVNFDLYLGDSVICRVTNNFKKTLKIKKDGLNTIWAKTEAKAETPINIKIGKEYYVRCGITMGAFVGHPKIEVVSNDIGQPEFRSISISKKESSDKIIMNDGREIACNIEKEDTDYVFISLFQNGKEIKTQITKSQIKQIIKEN